MEIALGKVDKLLEQAEKIIWMKVNMLVTEILTAKDNPACEFICAMGGYVFYDSDGEPLDGDETYASAIYGLFDKYDDAFKLTGAGIRWDLVGGKVIRRTDW
ncbi:hypothetical protein Q4R69_18625 [Morganella morganii subsp. sibonii]